MTPLVKRLPAAAAALAALAFASCGGGKKVPAPAAPPPPAPAAEAPAAPAQHGPAGKEWVYTSAGKRDPFKSFLAEAERAEKIETRCASPLGRFDVEQLRVVAVVTGLDDPMAMVEAPNGVGYNLRRGLCIGRNGGVVTAIRTGEVIVSEWVVRADGTREKAQTILRLPKQASLNIEE